MTGSPSSTAVRIKSMEDNVTRLDCETEKLREVVWGDGNGNKGIIRKLDHIEESTNSLSEKMIKMQDSVSWVLRIVVGSIISAVLYLVVSHGTQLIK